MKPCILLLVLALLCTGCMELLHNARVQKAAAEAIGPCAEIVTRGDSVDGWLWHATGCGKEAWCAYAKSDGKMTCSIERPVDPVEVAARAALPCPSGALTKEVLRLHPLDPSRAEAPWLDSEITGCGRSVWCGRNEERVACRQTPDFEVAAAQLALETQCETARIEPVQRQIFTRREWSEVRGVLEMQISWRLNACSKAYVCAVTGGAAASVSCKAALDTQP